MRALKIAVVVMGVMLVVGFVALILAIAYRMQHPPTPRDAPAIAASPGGKPFTAAAVDLPPGSKIETMSVGTDRVVLNLLLPDGNRQLLVLDLGSGRPVGTIPLHAAP